MCLKWAVMCGSVREKIFNSLKDQVEVRAALLLQHCSAFSNTLLLVQTWDYNSQNAMQLYQEIHLTSLQSNGDISKKALHKTGGERAGLTKLIKRRCIGHVVLMSLQNYWVKNSSIRN